MKRRQQGFTLIELIVVIIILGILAATALPRYSALQTQARIAKLNAALGAMRGAAALAHGACLAQQPQCTASLTMEGVAIPMVNQYPTATAGGIIAAAGITLTSAEGYQAPTCSTPTCTVEVIGNVPGTCSVSYTEAAVNAAPTFSALTTTGC